MKLYVTNLSPKITEQALKQLFGQYGTVANIEIEWVRKAGRSTGQAIVEMGIVEARHAARELNGHPFQNRRLYVCIIEDTIPGMPPRISFNAKTRRAAK